MRTGRHKLTTDWQTVILASKGDYDVLLFWRSPKGLWWWSKLKGFLLWVSPNRQDKMLMLTRSRCRECSNGFSDIFNGEVWKVQLPCGSHLTLSLMLEDLVEWALSGKWYILWKTPYSGQPWVELIWGKILGSFTKGFNKIPISCHRPICPPKAWFIITGDCTSILKVLVIFKAMIFSNDN